MKKLANAARLSVLAIVAAVSLAVAHPINPAYAQEASPPEQIIPPEITPACADPVTQTATWNVVNKNNTDVPLDWGNLVDEQKGTHTATPGQTTAQTSLTPIDPNNTTDFSWPGGNLKTNAGQTPCAPIISAPAPTIEPLAEQPACIDGSVQQNLDTWWNTENEIAFHTKDNRPLCEDIIVYLSSYTMPDYYDGGPFAGNLTAIPQVIFDSAFMVLKKDTDGAGVLSVRMPDVCKNRQIDLYYAPEATLIGPEGHGTKNIIGKSFKRDALKEECQGAGGFFGGIPGIPGIPIPGVPGPGAPIPAPIGQPAPPVPGGPGPAPGSIPAPGAPIPAVPTSAPMPSSLPVTGPNNHVWLIGLILAAGVYGVTYLTQRQLAAGSAK